MRQRILIDLLQMTVPMISMNVPARLPNPATKRFHLTISHLSFHIVVLYVFFVVKNGVGLTTENKKITKV